MNLSTSEIEMIADTPANTGAIGPALVVRNVNLTFPDGEQGLHVLSDISFSVAAEEFVCILGPSGSGKSTLLRILAGLLTPSEGEVSYPDLPNGDSGQPIGFVFQKANLIPCHWNCSISPRPVQTTRLSN